MIIIANQYTIKPHHQPHDPSYFTQNRARTNYPHASALQWFHKKHENKKSLVQRKRDVMHGDVLYITSNHTTLKHMKSVAVVQRKKSMRISAVPRATTKNAVQKHHLGPTRPLTTTQQNRNWIHSTKHDECLLSSFASRQAYRVQSTIVTYAKFSTPPPSIAEIKKMGTVPCSGARRP